MVTFTQIVISLVALAQVIGAGAIVWHNYKNVKSVDKDDE